MCTAGYRQPDVSGSRAGARYPAMGPTHGRNGVPLPQASPWHQASVTPALPSTRAGRPREGCLDVAFPSRKHPLALGRGPASGAGDTGGCLPPSLHVFPFLLAPTASRLRLPDEYLKAWILCSLMNIDGCWLQPRWPSLSMSLPVSLSVSLFGHGQQGRDAGTGEGSSKGCPRHTSP